MAKLAIGTEFTELLGAVGENTAVWKSAGLTESKAACSAGFVKKLGSSGATFTLFPPSSHPACHPASSSVSCHQALEQADRGSEAEMLIAVELECTQMWTINRSQCRRGNALRRGQWGIQGGVFSTEVYLVTDIVKNYCQLWSVLLLLIFYRLYRLYCLHLGRVSRHFALDMPFR